jgi:GTP pyrophosphokinase
MTIQKIINKTSSYLNKKDQNLIIKSYQLAQKIHQKEKRKSGVAYIKHPLSTAYYLAEEKLDAKTISASLLHDTLENSTYSIKYISKHIDPEVAILVNGVTKLNKVRINKRWHFPQTIIDKITGKERKIFEQHVNNLRKMFLAMTKDVRVILIKLADRLDNMKTLKYLPKEKQFEIAQETLEIYAPIAYRLGMGELKGTLEDLAFPYIYPKEYKYVKAISNTHYPKKYNYIDRFKTSLSRQLEKQNIYPEIHGRKKHIYSLYKKLKKYNNNINKIYDLVALRIIVDDTETCYKILGIIHKKYKPLIGRIKDYIAVTKPNGYRSLHTTVFGPYGEIVEIQIRTWEMHEQAELGIAAHWHYQINKSNNNKKSILQIPKQQTEWLEELARWHEKITDPDEWTSGLEMDFFRDQIFVFTPQGDIYNLPIESTPIDFAYSIHSEIGNSCKGATVNGKIVKLNTILKNGDIVKIITDKQNNKPKKDWLKFVKSHRAKNLIKSFFSKK